uniref:Uncharacterized protein n=1 Tax=Arundo donax TaxID=35708 RepID=A0A0A9H4X8_ARUDO
MYFFELHKRYGCKIGKHNTSNCHYSAIL